MCKWDNFTTGSPIPKPAGVLGRSARKAEVEARSGQKKIMDQEFNDRRGTCRSRLIYICTSTYISSQHTLDISIIHIH